MDFWAGGRWVHEREDGWTVGWMMMDRWVSGSAEGGSWVNERLPPSSCSHHRERGPACIRRSDEWTHSVSRTAETSPPHQLAAGLAAAGPAVCPAASGPVSILQPLPSRSSVLSTQ